MLSALLTLAVLLTLSRGAALAVLVMAVVFLLRFGVNRRILAGGSSNRGIMLALPSEFFTRFGEAAKTGGAGRLDIWYVAVEALKHYGVFGAGLSNFSTVYTSMQVTRLASWDLIGLRTISIWKCQWKPESSAYFCWPRRSGCNCGQGRKASVGRASQIRGWSRWRRPVGQS